MKKYNLGDNFTDTEIINLKLNSVDSEIDSIVKKVLELQKVVIEYRGDPALGFKENQYLKTVLNALYKTYSILAYLDRWEDNR